MFFTWVSEHRGKFDEKADEGIFIGYSRHSKAYRVFNKRLLKIVESVHVTFDEFDLLEPDQAPSSTDDSVILSPVTPAQLQTFLNQVRLTPLLHKLLMIPCSHKLHKLILP